MNARELKWSKAEKRVARTAFDAAYTRECEAIRSKLTEMVAHAADPRDLWHIHDYLTEQRKEADGKYDYRYSVLCFVFARLLNEGWLAEADLERLGADKMEWIRQIARR